MGKLILNSKGLNTKTGARIIHEKLFVLGISDLSDKGIFIVSFPGYGVDELIFRNCIDILGFKSERVRFSSEGIPNDNPEFIYVGEGNTFEILKYMRDRGLVTYIKEVCMKREDLIYLGSSAGAMIAGSDIMLARDFDSNYVGSYDFRSLELFEGTIIPHYEPTQLEVYKECIEVHLLNRYKKIYSVGNNDAIILD